MPLLAISELCSQEPRATLLQNHDWASAMLKAPHNLAINLAQNLHDCKCLGSGYRLGPTREGPAHRLNLAPSRIADHPRPGTAGQVSLLNVIT